MSNVAKASSLFGIIPPTSRRQFLQQHGFLNDPFRFQITEQAWGLDRPFTRQSYSLEAWLTAWYDHFQMSTLEYESNLREDASESDIYSATIVVGATGIGKTTFLYHLMEQYHRSPVKDTLVVFCDFAELNYTANPVRAHTYWSRSIAVALILSLLRNVSAYPHEIIHKWLTLLVSIGGTILQWWLHQLIHKKDTRLLTWQLLRYPLLFPLEITSEHKNIIESINTTLSPQREDFVPEAMELEEKMYPIFEALHISQIRLYVDNLTEASMNQPWINEYIDLVFDKNYFCKRDIKKTITISGSSIANLQYRMNRQHKYYRFCNIYITWNYEQIQALLRKRCCTTSGWVSLFEASIGKQTSLLENHIIQEADGSPRRLLGLMSALLDARTICDPDAEKITTQMWEWMRLHWDFDESIPSPLPISS